MSVSDFMKLNFEVYTL